MVTGDGSSKPCPGEPGMGGDHLSPLSISLVPPYFLDPGCTRPKSMLSYWPPCDLNYLCFGFFSATQVLLYLRAGATELEISIEMLGPSLLPHMDTRGNVAF
ncbi:hypothetical protein H920_16297 [Fukomys damarensis]|uniref:Uncharacterized protein n=1 Tax=Fukomys damarensis TaxID=885580 RepID=A0A091DHM4_FUKDA|nr:hypothetical protein H920_16297 [Fukomys damarensis]